MTAPVPPDANGLREDARSDRIKAGRAKHGVGPSEDFPGNICHLVSPIVGWMRLCERDGRPLDDLAHTIDRLSLVLDMANEEADRSLAASEAAPTAGEEEERTEFCEELGSHLADAMETIGIDDVDSSDGRVLADTVYCLGYRKPRPATPPAADASPSWMRDVPEEMLNEERLNVLLSEFYHSDDGDYVSALGDIRNHVAARESAAATRARAEGAAEAAERIARAIEAEASRSSYRDPYAATEAYLDAASIARSDAAPHTGAQS